MKLYRLFLTGLVVLLLGIPLVPNLAYGAEDIVIDDQVTDTNGFLTQSDRDSIQKAASKTMSKGFTMYYVLTPELTGSPLTTWCNQTAEKSNLPENSLVFAIGYENRKYVACHGPKFPLSDAEINQATAAAVAKLRSNPLEPDDTINGLNAFTDRMLSFTNSSASGSDKISLVSDCTICGYFTPIAFILALPILIGWIWLIQWHWKKRGERMARYRQLGGPDTTMQAKPLAVLLQESAGLLMATDNSVRSATDDLAFAQAQFGQLETQDFVSALQQAQSFVDNAFVTHTALTNTADERTQRQLAQQVQQLCQQAQAALSAMASRFEKLRADSANLPQTLRDLEAQIAEAEQKNEVAKAELEALRVSYADHQLQSLFDNPDNVTRLLSSSRAAVGLAQDTLNSGKVNAEQIAMQQVHLAQRSFGQAIGQINEVMYAASDLRESHQRLAAAIGSLGSDLQDVQRLAQHNSAFAGLVANAERAISAANQAMAGSGDVLAALADLRSAEDALDAALAPLRASEVQLQRTEQRFSLLDQEVTDLIRRTDAYINSRRGGVAQEARSMLAHAESARIGAVRQMHQYLQRPQLDDKQVEACFTQLRQALSYAQQALQHAQYDVQQATTNYGGAVRTGQSTQAGGIDLFSLILGGILSGGSLRNPGYDYDSRSSRSDNGGGFGWGSGGDFSGGGFSSGGGWSSSSSGSF